MPPRDAASDAAPVAAQTAYAAAAVTPPTPLFDERLRLQTAERLARFPRQASSDGSLRPAAVTLVLTPGEHGEACFVITRRAPRLARHAHQWALPGGRLDAGETAIEAALRETEEEVGLRLSPSSVLGLLDDFPTRSGFCMTPIVAWAEAGQTPVGNPDEVERVHLVPLGELLKPEVPVLRQIPESDRPVLSIPMLGTLIHSPTAAILYQLREVVLADRPTRVAHYEQPLFAWK
ncbi:MAG: CoA pyrophosphatase [Myxococcota bacterium]